MVIKGGKHSVETRILMREKKLGRVLSDETKAKISQANSGRETPPYTVAKFMASRILHRLFGQFEVN